LRCDVTRLRCVVVDFTTVHSCMCPQPAEKLRTVSKKVIADKEEAVVASVQHDNPVFEIKGSWASKICAKQLAEPGWQWVRSPFGADYSSVSEDGLTLVPSGQTVFGSSSNLPSLTLSQFGLNEVVYFEVLSF
jgi:homoaconitase/3-isopropylmalate dehydratase large subunit